VKPNIKDLSFKEFAAYLEEHNQPSYRTEQIWQWLYQKRAASFAEMTSLPASLRDQLDKDFSISRLKIVRQAESRDGTVKFLFGLSDGESIESVLIPEAKRLTLCISTQAGCGFGCAFCATALLGLKRNLRASEIVDQVLEVSRMQDPHPSLSLEGRGQEGRSLEARGISSPPQQGRITHVVLMGMGEPLANYAALVTALRILTDARLGFGYSPRRITVSILRPSTERTMRRGCIS